MNKKIFLLELITGFLGIILVLLFGAKGIAVIALYAISPFLKSKSEQTVENKLLFYKTNTLTCVFGFILLLVIFFCQDSILFTNTSLSVKDVWLYLFVTFILFAHGIIGLVMCKSNKE